MVIKDKLTGAERTALDQARLLLGDNLSALLLSGLGETQITHRRTFTARSMAEQGDETTHQLEMTNESELGLLIGPDLLVVAHLLNLLREEMRMAEKVDFSGDDILKTLGWSRTPVSHLLIKQAVERYCSTN